MHGFSGAGTSRPPCGWPGRWWASAGTSLPGKTVRRPHECKSIPPIAGTRRLAEHGVPCLPRRNARGGARSVLEEKDQSTRLLLDSGTGAWGGRRVPPEPMHTNLNDDTATGYISSGHSVICRNDRESIGLIRMSAVSRTAVDGVSAPDGGRSGANSKRAISRLQNRFSRIDNLRQLPARAAGRGATRLSRTELSA